LSPDVEDEQESSGLESSLSSSVLSPASSSPRTAEDDFDLRDPDLVLPQSWPIIFLSSLAFALLCLWLQVVVGLDPLVVLVVVDVVLIFLSSVVVTEDTEEAEDEEGEGAVAVSRDRVLGREGEGTGA